MIRAILIFLAGVLCPIDFIVSDFDFTNASASRAECVTVFGRYIGNARAGAMYDAARRYGINPMIVYTIAQRESGQFSRPTRGINDYCLGAWIHYDAARKTNQYQLFASQIELSPARLRYWYDRAGERGVWIYDRGERRYIIASNAATFSLYQYTPHYRGREGSGYHGNYTFPLIYSEFMARIVSNRVDKSAAKAYIQ